jgi:uncharacterized protein with GYD domain
VEDTARRAVEFREMAIGHGVTVKQIFWTLGQYDAVVIVEAGDELTMTALSLGLGALGNVRAQTLHAFSEADMQTILRKMA